MYDIIIKNGKVIDGGGNPWLYSDIGVKDGKIAKVGHLAGAEAKRIIDAKGKIVSPGFIDAHTHSDLAILKNPLANNAIHMGCTTQVVGNCGYGIAPISAEVAAGDVLVKRMIPQTKDMPIPWRTMAGYLDFVDETKTSINVASLVGMGILRQTVMGIENREPTAKELDTMKGLLEEAMQEGARGLSTGLVYTPCRFAKTEEIIELCKVVAKYDGLYTTHVRSQADWYEESLLEAIEIGEKSGVAVQLSHAGAMLPFWGETDRLFKPVLEARERGVDITFDVIGNMESIGSFGDMFPSWVTVGGYEKQLERMKDPANRERIISELKGENGFNWERNFPALCARAGRWDRIRILRCLADPSLSGKTIDVAAKERGQDPFDFLFDYLIGEGQLRGTSQSCFDDGDLLYLQSFPFQMFDSDTYIVPAGEEKFPRESGYFPNVIRRYVLDEKTMSMEEAIRKMTGYPAQRFKLKGRGLIREDMWADIVIFDPETIRDVGTLKDPGKKPEGIDFVIVNGVITSENQVHTGARAGRAIRD